MLLRSPQGIDDFYSLALLTLIALLVFGFLPAYWVISRRHQLARAWFADEASTSGVFIEPQALLTVGLVLLGVGTILAGLAGVPVAAIQLYMAGSAAKIPSELWSGGIGSSLRAGVQLVLGVVLLRQARAISARFT